MRVGPDQRIGVDTPVKPTVREETVEAEQS